MSDIVVFDTNVLISGLLWHGEAYQCLLMARAGLVQAVYCREMLAELSEKLEEVFGFSTDRIRSVLRDVKRFAREAQIAGSLHVVTKDPDDDMFVECAVVTGAQWIVSGDWHLLNLGEYQSIRIVKAKEFLARFARSEEHGD